MVSRNSSKSSGFEDASVAPQRPPGRPHAGEAGGRGGRVLMDEDCLHGSMVVEGEGDKKGEVQVKRTGVYTEEDRGNLKDLIDDSQNLVNWFSADNDNPNKLTEDISMAEFKAAMKSLGIGPKPELFALVENGDLATSIRAIQLFNAKSSISIKTLDNAKKAEREKKAAERAAKKSKEAAAKKTKKDKEEQEKKDHENILLMEASIILTLDKGTLPVSSQVDSKQQKVDSETEFYRYNDHGLQFQFGSADFTGMKLFKDGTFEFKNGYKMEFSSARQFIEQSEGLFDNLKGTYDIVWGEMREDSVGKKVRRIPGGKGEELRAPKRPSLIGKKGEGSTVGRRSSRALLGALSNSKLGLGLMRMTSTRGTLRVNKEEGGVGGGGEEDEDKDKVMYVPLEIVLHPEDMEARRQGLDITQTWGCYEPDESGKVCTIQRKLSVTKPGEVFVFPEKPAAAAANGEKKK